MFSNRTNRVGNCAAPKLLNEAARRQLRPCGVAEIFVGRSSGKSTQREDGALYDACEGSCSKILGFMLCGLDELPPMEECETDDGLLDQVRAHEHHSGCEHDLD